MPEGSILRHVEIKFLQNPKQPFLIRLLGGFLVLLRLRASDGQGRLK